MGEELEHGNHLLAELTGQQHLTLHLAIRHLAAVVAAVVMAIGHHRRGGLGRHDVAAAAAVVDLSAVLRQHPVHDGVAAHGLPQGGGGSHDGSAGGLEQRGGNGSDGSGGRSGVAAAGIEVLVVEQLCGGEVGPLGWRRRTRV